MAERKRNDDIDFYEKIISHQATENDYMLSLMMLSKMLHEYHGIEPVIIIDEYDTPIQQGHSNGFYDDVVLFVRNLFSGAFKDNKHLKYGFLTGILRVAKESIFSGLNNLKINSILDNKYSEYFGFTTDEVKEMADYYSASDKFDEICEWYDGYQFGKTDIFNPWSVINYFSSECLPRAFWLSTGSNDVIGEILTHVDEETYERLHALLQGGVLPDLYRYQRDLSTDSEESFFHLQLSVGRRLFENTEDWNGCIGRLYVRGVAAK